MTAVASITPSNGPSVSLSALVYPPWIARPYDLITWLDMQKFSAEVFYTIGQSFGALAGVYSESAKADEPMTAAEIARLTPKLLRGLQARCKSVGLNVSAALLETVINTISDIEKRPFTRRNLSASLDHISETISIEMSQSLFMHINQDRAKLYDQRELFGTAVNAKFPAVQFDIVEAGNCYAAGRGTAVVFHLMRIMESGVQTFGTKLGVVLADEKNWQNILDEVNKKIKALPARDPDTVKMSQASANLYAVKLAWRNEVMHPKDTYTLEEADNLIRQVKIFMEQLAMII